MLARSYKACSSQSEWYIYSGSSHQMINDRSAFDSYKGENNHTEVTWTATNTVTSINGTKDDMLLDEHYYNVQNVPKFNINLLFMYS